jgi:zinc protease
LFKKGNFPDLGIVQIDYENGLRLNYKKTDYKAKEILAEIGFGPGKAGEPLEKPGLSELSQNVVNESGVGLLDMEDLSRALAGKNTTVDFTY